MLIAYSEIINCFRTTAVLFLIFVNALLPIKRFGRLRDHLSSNKGPAYLG